MTSNDENRTALILGRIIVVLLLVLIAGGVLYWFTMPA
jgi:hypothetical protein